MEENYDLIELDRKVREYISGKRYLHTVGVRYTAAALAMAFGEDIAKAEAAGLLHDCAKKIPDEKKLKLCEKNHIEITECEKRNPFLLHTKVGAFMAEKDFGIKDPDILNAIRYHTTGRPEMSRLEQIIFIADYIEPRRDKAKNLKALRQAAFRDLDECTFMELTDMLNYLKEKGGELDEMTKDAYEYYASIQKEKGL
jgi:predicted HD superfamily hydrolase involved in NAD metabolism